MLGVAALGVAALVVISARHMWKEGKTVEVLIDHIF